MKVTPVMGFPLTGSSGFNDGQLVNGNGDDGEGNPLTVGSRVRDGLPGPIGQPERLGKMVWPSIG